MADDINVVVNEVTRVARNDAGQYLLNDGRVLDVYDPSLKGQYKTEVFIKYNTYTMTGVMDVDDISQLRQMTLGQLVMALCLQRATVVESEIVSLMDDIAKNTAQINALSMLDNKLAVFNTGSTYLGLEFGKGTWSESTIDYKYLDMSSSEMELFSQYSSQGYGTSTLKLTDCWTNWLNDVVKVDNKIPNSCSHGWMVEPTQVQSAVSQINTKLDALNSLSQELLIELQSRTSKRDQAYDMVSGILKSLNTTLTGNAHNI